MSLTSFIKEKPVSNKLREYFPKPNPNLKAEIIAAPKTENYSLIGTAFDYLFRFWLRKEYSDVNKRKWAAETALEYFIHRSSFLYLIGSAVESPNRYMIDLKEGNVVYDSFVDVIDFLPSEEKKFREKVRSTPNLGGPPFFEDPYEEYKFLRKAVKVLDKAKERLRNFIKTGRISNGLLKSSIDLARLDTIYRANRIPEKLGEYNKKDIIDLKNLYKAIPKKKFSGADEVNLNPTFGSASKLVGGADADLILDHKLLDIKTVKHLRLTQRYWHQIVGYAVLADITKEELPEVREVGIYFSRHGKLWTIDASRIYGISGYKDFKSWFIEQARLPRVISSFKNIKRG